MAWHDGQIGGFDTRIYRISFSGELSYEIAVDAHQGRAFWDALLKDSFDRSPMDFLKELRLQRAALLLKTTRRPIKSIADQIGFDSRSHFSRSFTDYYSVTPAEYRNATD